MLDYQLTVSLTKSGLIGRVCATYLKNYLKDYNKAEGTARFVVSQLKAEHTVAIAQAILDDWELAQNIEIKFPRHYVQGFDLPESVLTDKRATYYRNVNISKPILLLANTGDDEEQSMKFIMPIGTNQLLAQNNLWLQIASHGLHLTNNDISYWENSLKGLVDLNRYPFDRIVDYIITIREQIEKEGLPLIKALGAALPALMLPKDTYYFEAIAEKYRSRPSIWKKQYENADRQRAPYLRKQTPSQTILSDSELRASFNKVKESIKEDLFPCIEAFIESPDGWNIQAYELANCEWGDIKPLFSGLRREKSNIGKDTKEFYENSEPDLLMNEDVDYLNRLAKRNTNASDEEDKSFYYAHSQEFKNDRKLKSAWDKFIHGAPVETEDFMEGILLCFERLFTGKDSVNKKLRISLDKRSKNDLRELNYDAGLHFSFRYRGIIELLGKNVIWDVGELFNYRTLFNSKNQPKYSVAKTALQLKFTLELSSETLTGNEYKDTTQLVWKFDPNKVITEMALDWSRLVDHPMVKCYAARETLSSKGSFQTVDLSNIKTFTPTYDKNRGSFVPTYKAKNNIAKQWLDNLRESLKLGLISSDVETDLKAKWKLFEKQYTSAIVGFLENGIVCRDLFEQAHAYGILLMTICKNAKGDKNRALLLRPLLEIGSVHIEGGGPTEIIAPWHPLRMLAIGVKACRVGAFVQHFLEALEIQFGDSGRLFFKAIHEELQHSFYPEVVIGWLKNKPELLALSDTCGDYTLHEVPNVGILDLDETSDNPTEGAARVVELVNRYVSLQPHEKSNLSVVLYNCDSARLPQAVVDKIGRLKEDEEDFHCHIVLRHRDDQKLRHLYERIIESSDTDPDAYSASEATRDFMARLRIGISADQAIAPPNSDGPPNDIVFSQDVIARHARIEWYSENANPVALSKLIPVHWSRRRPAAFDDMKSVVYLCCPAQSEEGWSYLTAITTFFKGDWDGNQYKRLLPARQLDFNEPNMSQIFIETHHLGNWVVNFDELLDRRQLVNQGVRVIRYKQFSTQGRNLVVSSNAPLGLLKSMVLSRIRSLELGLNNKEQSDLVDKFIREANDISGDIVLRAAKRGRNASELMGIVLSRFLIKKELQSREGPSANFGWYFLDDYATWLGQKEEQIADILMLCPSISAEGKLRLSIVITEAKYVDYSNYVIGAKNSRNQLRDTVRRFQDALFGDPLRIDRELWLGRLADLILDGVQFPASLNLELSKWRRAIREGTCEFWIRGYSHVFISSQIENQDVSEFSTIVEMNEGFQEIYSFSKVKELVLKYFWDEDPTLERMSSHEKEIQTEAKFQTSTGSLHLPYSCIGLQVETNHLSKNVLEFERGKFEIENAPISLEGDLTVKKEPEINKKEQYSDNPIVDKKTDGASSLKDQLASLWKYSKIETIIAKKLSPDEQLSDEIKWLKFVEGRTREALQGLGLQAKLISSKLTPNAALLKFQGSANLTLDQVLRKQTEFKTTYGLSLISAQPEPGLIALSIERPNRQIVTLEEVWKLWESNRADWKEALPIAIREDNGQILFLSPQRRHAPHTLIAGSTGSGKSVLMQNIILSIAATNTAEEAKIILIDPKLGVDYFALESLPHLDEGIIDNQERALEKLQSLVEEMDRRYRLFKVAKVSNLSGYNKKVDIQDKLPVLWLIHDEFAEWMLVEEYKQEVSAIVGRLGVKARAAGIHLVFAAQRPDANVVPMQLRANLGNRLILRVDSEGTSEIALGVKGAERLLGKGHILTKLEGETNLIFGQVPFTSEETIRAIVQILE